jgi:cell division protein FtsL
MAAILMLSYNLYPLIAMAICCTVLVLILKAYYVYSSKSKIKKYQGEIAKSHARILRLEMANEALQKKIDELEGRVTPTNKMRIA